MIQAGAKPAVDMGFLGKGGLYQMTPGTPQLPQVNTTINPQNAFSPQQTQHAVNQNAADYAKQSNLRYLLKGQDRPGVSRSAGSISAVMPQLMGLTSQAAYNQAMIPYADAQANSAMQLQGQQARSNEFQNLARGYMNNQNLDFQQQQQNLNSLLQLLGMVG